MSHHQKMECAISRKNKPNRVEGNEFSPHSSFTSPGDTMGDSLSFSGLICLSYKIRDWGQVISKNPSSLAFSESKTLPKAGVVPSLNQRSLHQLPTHTHFQPLVPSFRHKQKLCKQQNDKNSPQSENISKGLKVQKAKEEIEVRGQAFLQTG